MTNAKPIVGNRVYDILKWMVQIALPATATAYFAIAEIWGLPSAMQVVGTITAITTLLGALLGISSYQYVHSGAKFDGTMKVNGRMGGGEVYNLELDKEPEDLAKMKELVFKVDDNRLSDSPQ